ncbi:MAG: Gfo/Idh/MocA family oxidoreductase [Verrucomicrobiota bacterium]|jgi:predicted dehydrogenase
MPAKLRCAVIGTGSIGLSHLKSLVRCPQAALAAIAEKNPERARQAAARFQIPRIYTDYRELLDQPDIEAVTIAIPNYLHAPVAIEALQARKHVLLEKPMATSVREAVRICDTARKMQRVLMVGQNFRFSHHTQVAKTLMERGDLGQVYHARGHWLRRSGIPRIGSWFTQKQFAGGGCAFDLGVHVLDTCFHLLGDFEVLSVRGQINSHFGSRGLGEFDWGSSEIDPAKPFDVEDSVYAFLKMKRGTTLSFEVSWASLEPERKSDLNLEFLGTQAGLALFPARLFRPGSGGYETIELNQIKVPHPEDRIHHFVQCVLFGRKPIVTLEQSLQVQRVLEAIYQSSNSNKEVVLK